MHDIVEIQVSFLNGSYGGSQTRISGKEELLEKLDQGWEIVDKFTQNNKIFFIMKEGKKNGTVDQGGR